MAASDEIKAIYKEELDKLKKKYKLTEQDAERIYSVFCYMYDKNCNGVSDYEIYYRLKSE